MDFLGCHCCFPHKPSATSPLCSFRRRPEWEWNGMKVERHSLLWSAPLEEGAEWKWRLKSSPPCMSCLFANTSKSASFISRSSMILCSSCLASSIRDRSLESMTKMRPCVPVENRYYPVSQASTFCSQPFTQPVAVIIAVDVCILPSYRRNNASTAAESYPALPRPKR